MRQGIVEEDEAVTGGRGTDEHGSGLSDLWETFGGGDSVQIPWLGDQGIGWWLAGGGSKYEDSVEAVAADFKDTWLGGVRPPDIWYLL